MKGSRSQGQSLDSRPARKSRIDMSYNSDSGAPSVSPYVHLLPSFVTEELDARGIETGKNVAHGGEERVRDETRQRPVQRHPNGASVPMAHTVRRVPPTLDPSGPGPQSHPYRQQMATPINPPSHNQYAQYAPNRTVPPQHRSNQDPSHHRNNTPAQMSHSVSNNLPHAPVPPNYQNGHIRQNGSAMVPQQSTPTMMPPPHTKVQHQQPPYPTNNPPYPVERPQQQHISSHPAQPMLQHHQQPPPQLVDQRYQRIQPPPSSLNNRQPSTPTTPTSISSSSSSRSAPSQYAQQVPVPQNLQQQLPMAIQKQAQQYQSNNRSVSMPITNTNIPLNGANGGNMINNRRTMNSIPQQQQLNNYSSSSLQQDRTMSLSSSSASTIHSKSSNDINKKSSISHTFSLSSKSRSFSSLTKNSLSLSQRKSSVSSSSSSLTKTGTISKNNSFAQNRNSSMNTLSSAKTILTSSKKPQVYPALLSKVSKLFKSTIQLSINKKDGLEYHDSFTGKQAVDAICKIIRTNDRNLALLLGRSMDAQKYFHDVTYSHRLRDSNNEVYAFSNNFSDLEGQQVNGVFTILTDCYSPTCTRNNLCYSIACPRRLEQQARLNMKPEGGLARSESRISFHENESKNLWHDTVPPKVLDGLTKNEKQKQELIYEFIYTERDYVKDLEFMTDFYINPLRRLDIIPERERDAFIRTVFGGVSELLSIAKRFSDALTKRQQLQKPVVNRLGDIVLENIPYFDPFIKYGGNKCFASFEHERQQKVNFRYVQFLTEVEKKPESRRNDLSSFLIKGIQRPAKYQLLIQGIIKYSEETDPDYKDLVEACEQVGKLLKKINITSGQSADRHKIMVLHNLIGKQVLEEKYFFKLDYKSRIIYQATLSTKRDNEKIDVYLFEHALLLIKHKMQNKREQYKVFEKPIYLPLLFTNTSIDFPTLRQAINNKLNGSIISDNSFKPKVDNAVNASKFNINFFSLGNSNIHQSLFASDIANQNQVVQQIFNQQRKLINNSDIFTLTKFETRRFHGNNKINCAVPCYGGKKLLYGTDTGVWVSTVRTISLATNEKICSDPTLVIDMVNITQLEVLVEISKLLVLSDKKLYEFDLSCTDSLDHAKNTRSGREILNHVNFFKTGICDGKLIVVCAKLGSTNTINIFEPIMPYDNSSAGKLKAKKKYEFKEFSFNSLPVSISFLKTKLCIGCTKGFEILSLEKGKKEPILDEADPSLDFATQRESVNPLAIHRLGKEVLLSYSEFSFLINRNGWRTNHQWGIYWEGIPQNIALFYPFLLAFEPGFIEVRDLNSTNILRAVVGENIRFLHSNEHEALYACEENGYDIIVSIDFLNLKPKTSITSAASTITNGSSALTKV